MRYYVDHKSKLVYNDLGYQIHPITMGVLVTHNGCESEEEFFSKYGGKHIEVSLPSFHTDACVNIDGDVSRLSIID